MKWALILSGGGARGLAHIGVIKELERLGVPPPSLIAGTSMGAIIGGLYASGWNAAQLEAYTREFDFRDPLSYIRLGERTAMDASAEINRFFTLGPSRIVSRIATLFGWKPSTKA